MNETEFDLSIELSLQASRANLWRCWTEPELLTQWFTPSPWSTAAAALELRPGGQMSVTMRSPQGEEVPNEGVILEVVEQQRLVTTDAYTPGWQPAEKPFMTMIMTLADAEQPGHTLYKVVARHWSATDRDTHQQMGFEQGWVAAARQLESLAATL